MAAARRPPADHRDIEAPPEATRAAAGMLWVRSGLVHAAGRVLDVLLPPQCLCCDTPVSTQGQLCARCFGGIGLIAGPVCDRCGVPFATAGPSGGGLLCPACVAAPPRYGRARAALRYDGSSRKLILPLKHADRPELAGALAPHMLRAGAALLCRADILVPVPLHRRRLFRRRYNQAALLAGALSRLSGIPAALDGLVRHRPTAPLGDSSAAERAAAVQGAFAVRPLRAAGIAGRHVVLVDDVMTSGATANACAETLLNAGAIAVDVLVAARVPDPRL